MSEREHATPMGVVGWSETEKDCTKPCLHVSSSRETSRGASEGYRANVEC